MQTTAGTIATITEVPSTIPDVLHRPEDAVKLAALVSDMTQRGWMGAPVVVLGDQALTGSHRIMAAIDADYVPIPRVQVDALCETYGIDWVELRDEHGDDWYAAAAALRDLLSQEVVEYLGYDVDGA